jgi:hypothetical protein
MKFSIWFQVDSKSHQGNLLSVHIVHNSLEDVDGIVF